MTARETNAGAEQMIKICYRFWRLHRGTGIFRKGAETPFAGKTPALSKKGKAMGKISLVS